MHVESDTFFSVTSILSLLFGRQTVTETLFWNELKHTVHHFVVIFLSNFLSVFSWYKRWYCWQCRLYLKSTGANQAFCHCSSHSQWCHTLNWMVGSAAVRSSISVSNRAQNLICFSSFRLTNRWRQKQNQNTLEMRVIIYCSSQSQQKELLLQQHGTLPYSVPDICLLAGSYLVRLNLLKLTTNQKKQTNDMWLWKCGTSESRLLIIESLIHQ